MDDLDALLEDLGRPKSTQIKKPRAPSSRVDLDELEGLMQDLAAPSTRSVNAPLPPAAVPASAPASRPITMSEPDDLDALMASLNSMPRESVSYAEPVPAQPEPVQEYAHHDDYQQHNHAHQDYNHSADQTYDSLSNGLDVDLNFSTPAHEYQPAPVQPSYQTPAARVSVGATGGMDDLDALLNGLSAEPSRTSVAPAPRVSMPPARANPPVVTQPPRVAQPTVDIYSQPVYTPPQPAYTPPQQTYSAPRPAAPPAAAAPRAGPPRASTLQGDDLDNLLTNLTSQMTDIDSSTPAARGVCQSCRKPILGEVIQALGKTFHPEHFVCGNCQNPLGTSNFYEQDGAPHCERCYQDLFCSRCAHCDESILDRCITALGKKWHIHHFVCTTCLKPFEGGSFFERDGRPYCEADFYNVYAPKCAGCNQSIKGECINALGTAWHPEHFVCQYCQKSFGGGTFYEFGGKPYCDVHYHQQTGSLCGGCGKAIVGRCVNALDKKWHPEHFVCAFCMNPLAGGAFTENNGKAYCKECHGKLFG
eukprot:TRINITY_DN37_c0_g1_i1.p1 TRINITY_DN37_c0_g1~~TRINITY_DN37_c0_g1_i1.p1  ORF type:complete len:533 (-),score=158.98 TRINITY_DN37_c0_g1_i1:142-1740(-)